ncbi:MAG: class I SAM-dependent methyltransferase [Saprospiraceae bacterium]|nr:class I SAM-dependent methyltransferase [Saprospiraceae bacterium]
MEKPNPTIYQPEFVKALFDEMSATYNTVNSITSFGFSTRWRRQCVRKVDLQPGNTVVDMMAGMGETWPYILPQTGSEGRLTGLDYSHAMLSFAQKRALEYADYQIVIHCEDALSSSIPSNSADVLVCSFGLKTLSPEQTILFAREISRILKPGGTFSLIEISVPPGFLLRWPYLFYLKYIIPLLGKILLGNPDNYRKLGIYTEAFGSCRSALTMFEQAGLDVRYESYFGGCASGLTGRKP